MCGIAGILSFNREAFDEKVHLEAMLTRLKHRGPDSKGTWISPDRSVGLGHSRLSIIDLSTSGAQPMVSRSGNTVITYNGEIYNYREIRKELESRGAVFRGTSDTEVFLEGIESFGLEPLLGKLNGMFAAAVYNVPEQTITLVRDRIGIKPLYYGRGEDFFLFSSELSAIKAAELGGTTINYDALALFFRFGYVPGAYSIYNEFLKLPRGTFLKLSRSQLEQGNLPEPTEYWSPMTIETNSAISSKRAAVDLVEASLKKAVEFRTVADVPLGAFLSGGIDSSLVVAMLAGLRSEKVKTFSIGFHESQFNEAPFAQKIADHLNTDHTSLYVTAEDTLELVPDLIRMHDEPFADASSLPTLLVSRLARSAVTVSLSGDGGDELFGGYRHYGTARKRLKFLRGLSYTNRMVIHKSLPLLMYIAERFSSVWHSKLEKLRQVLPGSERGLVFAQVLSHWNSGKRGLYLPFFPNKESLTFKEYMSVCDMGMYLVDDILVKLDRATMSVGLEGRVPMLDHNFVETVLSIPPQYRFLPDKKLLRLTLNRYVPKELYERPKAGFEVPLGKWLRGPLREWARDLIFTDSPTDEVLNPRIVHRRWKEHVSMKADWKYLLWDVLVARAWLREHGE